MGDEKTAWGGRKIVAELEYVPKEPQKGYTRETLYVNLGTGAIETRPVPDVMIDKFIGGRGFDLYLTWNGVKADTRWDDPDNEICISSGPLGGTGVYPGAGKSIVTAISPLTGIICDSNVGGYFGPYLKFSGFDALEIQGKSDKELILVVDGDHKRIALLEAGGEDSKNPDTYVVTEKFTEEFGELAEKGKQSVSVVSSGSAASHSRWGCLNFSFYDKSRKRARYKQAGRGGLGSVFRDKGLLALVCLRSQHGPFDNQPAVKDRLVKAAKYHGGEIRDLDPKQNRMREIGTAHLPSIMSEFDLLPTHNFKFGHTKYDQTLWGPVFERVYDRKMNDGCYYGCSVSCSHAISDYELQTGPYKGQFVSIDGPEYETIAGCGSNLGIFDWGPVAEINYYCDTYGIDTISFGTGTAFVMECFETGILDTKKTDGLELRFGNWRAALELLHRMARGEGFGVTVGQGIRRMKEHFVREFGADPAFLDDIGMESKGLEFSEYMTKESLAQQGGYGLTLKGPQHDEAWLIFLDMVHNYMPTFEQKAEALHWFPMFRTWFGLVGLCKLPWNDIVPEDNKETKEPAKVIKHVESYAEFFSSVTGREVGADDL
ncbi:MAG: aldehyde ferredoxin oxidoreductase family protein, partial [Planctomycetota bacterium]